MTGLFVVRREHVPVEQLVAGDVIVLPSTRRVTVEHVDEYDGFFIARWWRPAERGEPGHKGREWNRPEALSDAMDGRYLGSTMLLPAGHLIEVDRG